MYLAHCNTMGDLSVHDYFNKIKKIADLLKGIGEKVKDKHVVIHAINGLSSKFESTASFTRNSKPIPSFVEARSMLLAEERRLLTTRIPNPSHDSHPSSPQLLNMNNSSSNRGGGTNSRRNQRGGGPQNSNQRRRTPPSSNHAQPAATVGHPATAVGQPYGWFYIPPPLNNQPLQMPLYVNHQPAHTSSWGFNQAQPTNYSWGRPNSNNTAGLLGSRPPATSIQHSSPQAYQASTIQPPWAWLGSPDQPTLLPSLFSTMTLQDPSNGGWVMDTGATDHVHADADTPTSHPL